MRRWWMANRERSVYDCPVTLKCLECQMYYGYTSIDQIRRHHLDKHSELVSVDMVRYWTSIWSNKFIVKNYPDGPFWSNIVRTSYYWYHGRPTTGITL